MDKNARAVAVSRLGDLEVDIMSVLWDRGEATVHDVVRALAPRRDLAYTTVMTVMSRLAEKGLLARRKVGRAFLYSPAAPEEGVAGSLLRALVRRLYRGSPSRAIAHLLELDENVDEAELVRLERLIRARRLRGQP